MAILKNKEEIENLKEGGRILARILNLLKDEIKVGVKTQTLESKAKELIDKFGTRSSFLGYKNYPTVLCVSINDEIVHGVPSERVIQNGDIVKIDLGIWYKDLTTDSALTVPVGVLASPNITELIEATKRALYAGIGAAKVDKSTGAIGQVIQNEIEKSGFVVIKELSGHGVGRGVHESPTVANFGKSGEGVKLEEGMVLAIEPMAALFGTGKISESGDGFGYRTEDGAWTAHFEHTVLITNKKPLIVTQDN
jgi:methionyl aminopeptidase